MVIGEKLMTLLEGAHGSASQTNIILGRAHSIRTARNRNIFKIKLSQTISSGPAIVVLRRKRGFCAKRFHWNVTTFLEKNKHKLILSKTTPRVPH